MEVEFGQWRQGLCSWRRGLGCALCVWGWGLFDSSGPRSSPSRWVLAGVDVLGFGFSVILESGSASCRSTTPTLSHYTNTNRLETETVQTEKRKRRSGARLLCVGEIKVQLAEKKIKYNGVLYGGPAPPPGHTPAAFIQLDPPGPMWVQCRRRGRG